jgi:glycosyltransferase involved in cell wall biosynthesis
VIIGGQPDLIHQYEARVARMKIADRVTFAGIQKDVRPYLWASDAFVLPSLYEVFPLVALEAAAAGCLLVTSPLNGVEEFMVDGVNGLELAPNPKGVIQGLERLAATSPEDRQRMAAAAAQCIRQYTAERYAQDWRAVYSGG